MNAKRLFAATILLCATGAAIAGQGDGGATSPRFTESAATAGKTRAEVRAELTEAVKKGKLSKGQSHE